MGDEQNFGSLLVDRLESARTRDNSFTTYELQGWYGGDYNRAVLKAEGEVDGGKLHDARTELLWSHAVSAYWNTQLGVRYDSGLKPDRRWLAFGVQGWRRTGSRSTPPPTSASRDARHCDSRPNTSYC